MNKCAEDEKWLKHQCWKESKRMPLSEEVEWFIEKVSKIAADALVDTDEANIREEAYNLMLAKRTW